MAKSCRKKNNKKKKNNKANWMVSNSAKLDHRTKQHTQFGVSASNGSRDMTRTKSWQKKRKKKKEKNNEANWMVSNSAKLDCRTKQHTESGVSTSDGSRDMARTRSWRKKKEKKNELMESHKASPTGIAKYDTKQGIQEHDILESPTQALSCKMGWSKGGILIFVLLLVITFRFLFLRIQTRERAKCACSVFQFIIKRKK